MTGAKSVCIYGESGVGKTTNVGRFARYVHKTQAKRTRLISADQGGWGAIQPEIDAGLIDAFHLGVVLAPLATLRALSRGYWPQEPENPATKYLPPTPETWAQVGAYACESIASFGDTIMGSVRSKGVKLSQEPAYAFSEEREIFFGSNPSYYGFAQDTIYELVRAFNTLPVWRVLWTSLEGKGEEQTRTPIYGPAIAGRAAVSKVPQWMGDLIHLEGISRPGALDTVLKVPTMQYEVRAYFQRHPDPATGIHYPAKLRLPAAGWAQANKRWPMGFFSPRVVEGELVDGLDMILQFVDDMTREETERLKLAT